MLKLSNVAVDVTYNDCKVHVEPECEEKKIVCNMMDA